MTYIDGNEEKLGPKREKARGGCKKLHKELHNFHFQQNATNVINKGRSIGWGIWNERGSMRNPHKILIRKPRREETICKMI
jgi:hypothetical protein